ncbi:MAG: hypothetical protein JWM16_2243 [Verrucomicrobiales bacterium]|nr:hypothetical protein [Verrucomicrobiales bacterium]
MGYPSRTSRPSASMLIHSVFFSNSRGSAWVLLLLFLAASARADFVAFVGGGNTAPLPFTLTVTNTRPSGLSSSGAIPAAGTPAYTVFNGFVNFSTSLNQAQEFPLPIQSTYLLSRLNPNRRYSLKGTTVRGGGYLNRWTLFELANASSFSNAHTANCLISSKVSSLASNQVAINTGANNLAGTGDIFDWEDVQPGPDGTLAIICRQYTGLVPGGSAAGEYAYDLAFLRVQELGTSIGPIVITQQPAPQTNALGASVSFSVQAHGYGSALSYRWMKNGATVTGANQAAYTISSLNSSHAGTYSVEISNALYKVTSTNAELVISQPQPEILIQPLSVLAFDGSNAAFNVVARGASVLKYQWQWNGTNLPGATASNLNVGSAANSNAGPYRVVITNASGMAVSSEALLETTTIGAALDATNLVWVMDGSSVFWIPQTNVVHSGSTALQTGRFTRGGQINVLSASVTGPGTLRFWWKMNSANLSAGYQFSVDGINQARGSGVFDWQRAVLFVGSNSHTLSWKFFNNSSSTNDVVIGWLDDVSFLPGIQAPEFLSAPSNRTILVGTPFRFSTAVEGLPPLSYQWQFNFMDLPGATNAYLPLPKAQGSNAGTYTVIVSNPAGSVSASADLVVQPSAPVFLAQQTNIFAIPDGEVWLHARVVGTEPIHYQWTYEGGILPNQTNESLKLSHVGMANQGRYSVIASNSLGATPGPFLHVQTSTVRQVLHISVDGLGAFQLAHALESDPFRYPRFKRLFDESSWTLNARCDASNSVTVPNHLSMFTGRPVLRPEGQPATVEHGYTLDDTPSGFTVHKNGNTNVSYKASVFDVVHDRGGKTGFLAGKATMSICVESYNDGTGAEDLEGANNGRGKVDVIRYGASRYLVEEVVTNLLSSEPRQYTFLHFAEMDVTGHATGWGSPAWFDELEGVDALLDRLFSTLEFLNSQPGASSNQTVVILTADHGGGVPVTHHSVFWEPLDFTIPLLAWGPGYPAGADLHTRFVNRADPGTNYMLYSQVEQPLRNGDSGNIALMSLGLPFIPGSTLTPLPASSQPSVLLVKPGPASEELSWSRAFVNVQLESADALSESSEWTAVMTGVQTNINTISVTVPLSGSAKFFRLHRASP